LNLKVFTEPFKALGDTTFGLHIGSLLELLVGLFKGGDTNRHHLGGSETFAELGQQLGCAELAALLAVLFGLGGFVGGETGLPCCAKVSMEGVIELRSKTNEGDLYRGREVNEGGR
jgi:hypothetical protein